MSNDNAPAGQESTEHPGTRDAPDTDLPDDGDSGLRSGRRSLIKGLLFGGAVNPPTVGEGLLSRLLGGSQDAEEREPRGTDAGKSDPFAPPDYTPPDLDQGAVPDALKTGRIVESVSMKDIAEGTDDLSGPPYFVTELAERRRLLDLDHATNPRKDPPFALRELITSQRITIEDVKFEGSDKTHSWQNWVSDFKQDGLGKFRADSERDLVEAVIFSVREGESVRAIGAGHSHSKAAVPHTNLVELSWYDSGDVHGLVGGTEITGASQQWMNPAPGEQLFRAPAGSPIKYLNRKVLKDAGKALFNQGSFDAQTLAGAINTSTHGTGLRIGALSDTVRSVELAAVMESPAQSGKPVVRKFRIEPEGGLTDRPAFEDAVGDHGTTLIQDDDVFHSAVVGYGCMGVAYAYTIDVRDRYFLWEDNETLTWKQFKNEIPQRIGEPDYSEHYKSTTGARHFQFYVNLAQLDKRDNPPGDRDPRCLLITHREPVKYNGTAVPYQEWYDKPNWYDRRWPPERREMSFFKTLRSLRPDKKGLNPFDGVTNAVPPGINAQWGARQNNRPFEGPSQNIQAESSPSGHMSASYVALRRKRETSPAPGARPDPPPRAISTEIAVPADQVVKAIERVFDVIVNHKLAFHVPMGVRFVARSDHYLAPEHQSGNRYKPVAKVEVPFLVEPWKGLFGRLFNNYITNDQMLGHAKAALDDVENALVDMSNRGELDFARPHMGKTNNVGRRELEGFYGNFDTWQAVHERLDAFGTFNNRFTNAKGIDV